MMRYFLSFLLLVTVACAGFSREARAWGQILGNSEVLRGQFVEEHLMQGAQQPVRIEGRFALVPSQGVLWIVDRPVPFTFALTNAGMTQFLGPVPLMFRSADQVPVLAFLPLWVTRTLAADWDALDDDFVVLRSGKGARQRVKIMPRRGRPGEALMTQLVLDGERSIETATLTQRSGAVDRVTFSNLTVSANGLTGTEKDFFAKVKAPSGNDASTD